MIVNVSGRTKRSFAWLTALFFCGWLAVELYMPWRSVHYRLDVTFEVDGVPVTGSGVQKFFIICDRVPLSLGVLSMRTSCEAVIVDLPGKKSVFALMATAREDGSFRGRRIQFSGHKSLQSAREEQQKRRFKSCSACRQALWNMSNSS